jgi:signal transduction histidine kinase
VIRGPGIPLKDQERIFERFYRVGGDRARQTGGTGLGLSIVKNVVSAHGGRVTVESSPGAGAVFGVFLPLSLASKS